MRAWLIAVATFCTLIFVPTECASKDLVAANEASAPVVAKSTVAEISGTVRNILVNQGASVKMQITREANGEWRAKGEFDNKNLFGRFDVAGRPIFVRDDYVSVQFKGDIDFGPEGGWKVGTRSTYVMTICLRAADADGVYDIGLLPNRDYHQYGTMTLTTSKELLKAEQKAQQSE